MIKFYIKNTVEEFQKKYVFLDIENLKIYTSIDKEYYFVTISYFNDENEIIENIAVGSFKKDMKIEFFRKTVENEFTNVLMELPID